MGKRDNYTSYYWPLEGEDDLENQPTGTTSQSVLPAGIFLANSNHCGDSLHLARPINCSFHSSILIMYINFLLLGARLGPLGWAGIVSQDGPKLQGHWSVTVVYCHHSHFLVRGPLRNSRFAHDRLWRKSRNLLQKVQGRQLYSSGHAITKGEEQEVV